METRENNHPTPLAKDLLDGKLSPFEKIITLMMRLNSIKGTVNQDIHPNDDMCVNGNVDHYIGVGYSGARSVVMAMAMAEKTKVDRILDLPCGYGRVTRWLRPLFPEAEITACEILREGVDYCKEKFDCVPLYSTSNPAQIQVKGKFDLIFCGSLITHLPEKRTIQFLDFFKEHLEDNGILLISLHGRKMIQQKLYRQRHKKYGFRKRKFYEWIDLRKVSFDLNRKGFGHKAPPGTEYGGAFTKPEWVMKYLYHDLSFLMVYYTENMFDYSHDMLALQKMPVTERPDRYKVKFDAY